ncbi:MAG: 50S ribosomal protein L11 methyltransferase [Methylococcales bacterium]
MADWHRISVIGSDRSSESVAEVFTALGASSVTFTDAADQPLYEPPLDSHPLWHQTRIVALFENPVELEAVRESVSNALPGAALGNWNLEILADRVWEREWMDHFKPMQFGKRLRVYPSHQPPPDPAAVNLLLDPGLAFGTGAHPTTALCLEWLADNDLHELRIMDYGCGSGILAVAAILLGAINAIAVDIDEQALMATAANALNNGVVDRIICRFPAQIVNETVDIVIANILAKPLEELAPVLSGCVVPGGKLVLSGFFVEQIDAILDAYRDFIFAPPAIRENWVRLDGNKETRLYHRI